MYRIPGIVQITDPPKPLVRFSPFRRLKGTNPAYVGDIMVRIVGKSKGKFRRSPLMTRSSAAWSL
ncbi:MAG: hypothetical protein ACYS6W_09800 [Planctomycetota bacterium]|jgi:hypothetical protein